MTEKLFTGTLNKNQNKNKCHRLNTAFQRGYWTHQRYFPYENDISQLFIILSYRNNFVHLSTSHKSGKINVILAEQGKSVGMTLLRFGATS